MNRWRTDDFFNWLSASIALMATHRVFLIVPVVFDLIALMLWAGLSWVLLGESQLPIQFGQRDSVRFDLVQALPSVGMVVPTSRQVTVGDPLRPVAVFMLATLAMAVLRAYGMAGFVGWLDRIRLIRNADLNASTFHLLGRRFSRPMLGYTLLWAAFSFLSVSTATARLTAFLFSITKLLAGAVLMFTPYAVIHHAMCTLDGMAASVEFVWRNRELVAGLVLVGFLATATGSYVARSAMGLLGIAGYFVSMALWAPVGCVLSAFAYGMYINREKEE